MGLREISILIILPILFGVLASACSNGGCRVCTSLHFLLSLCFPCKIILIGEKLWEDAVGSGNLEFLILICFSVLAP